MHERQRTAKPGKRCIAIRVEVWGLSIKKGGWEVCDDTAWEKFKWHCYQELARKGAVPGLAPALELVNTLPQVEDSPRSEGDATKE